EVECGHHYARSMSSWALLTGLSGFEANMSENQLSFSPRMEVSTEKNRFQTFWSTGTAWGTYTLQRDSEGSDWTATTEVLGGHLNDTEISLHTKA
ncbi:MAG: hypothetical protein K8L99_12010, partial [Anaerolineae bacterium]|nr:hypothetical protein [Anaerolineae bacterium]